MSESLKLKRRKRLPFPNRRVLTVGRDKMRVLLSPEDADLARECWYPHQEGYVHQRPHAVGTTKRPIRWLHRVIADRMAAAAGDPPAKRIRFIDGQRLNCQRDNLRLIY